MKSTSCVALAVTTAILVPSWVGADEKKDKKSAVELRLVLEKDKIAWDAGGKSPKEFQKQLADIEAKQKNPRNEVTLPAAPKIGLTLEIRNTGKDAVTVFVGGDVNQYAFDLKGPGVKSLKYQVLTTADFRIPKAVKIEPGKSHSIKVAQLEDGFRGLGRRTYWTEPGEYTLSATYRLGTADGEQGPLLTSEPVKFKVVEGK